MTTFVSGPEIVCSSGAQLTATPNASMLAGSIAYVTTFGAFWVLQATGPAPDGSTVLAANDGRVWVRVLSGVQEAALAQTAFFVDGTSGNDENDGLTLGTPLKHIQEIVRRWGTRTPLLAVSVTINLVTSNTAADAWDIAPSFSGAGALIVKGVLTATTTSTIGAFTAAVRGGANTRGTITSPGVASWAGLAATLIRDTTASGTFFVSADLGAGVAAITNAVHFPIPTFPVPALTTLVNGDAIQLYTPPTLFVSRVGRNSICSAGVSVQLFNLTIAAANGVYAEVDNVFAAECVFSAIILRDIGLLPSAFASCYFSGQYSGVGNFQAGKLAGTTTLQGPIFNPQFITFDGDIELAGALLIEAPISFGSAYLSGAMSQERPSASVGMRPSPAYGPSGRGLVWGPGTIAIAAGAQLDASGGGGTAAQVFLNTGGLTLDGAANGSVFTQSTGLWSVGTVALTPAGIDTNLGYSNPRTGSRIHI